MYVEDNATAPDFFRIRVYENKGGALIYENEGELLGGNISVTGFKIK